eukprot:5510533-Prorocentrum_lima.AAC.1
MTSSLVGSEMCIRDSLSGGTPMRCRSMVVLARAVSHRDTPQRCSRKPVSYTHLTLPTICSV